MLAARSSRHEINVGCHVRRNDDWRTIVSTASDRPKAQLPGSGNVDAEPRSKPIETSSAIMAMLDDKQYQFSARVRNAPISSGFRRTRRRSVTSSLAYDGPSGRECVPFVASMAPSERVRAFGAPVQVDIAAFKPGELNTVEWRGKPVWVLLRTPAMVGALRGHDDLLADPSPEREEQQPGYARNEYRSIRPDIGVMVAICTHLGCVPTFRPEPGASDIGASWPGGFYCPCHGSRFDLAGRVFKNVPAPSNLEVPPHRYIGASMLLIGEGPPRG